MSFGKNGKFKRRQTQERHINPTERDGSAVPPEKRKTDRRRASKAAKAARRRNR